MTTVDETTLRVIEHLGSSARTLLHVLTLSEENMESMYGKQLQFDDCTEEVAHAIDAWELWRLTGKIED